MAIRYLVADDLDGSTTAVDTYQFSVDGVDYQIDLSDDNHQRLLAALAPFTAVARRMPKNGKAQTGRGNATKLRGATSADVRAWWAQHWQAHCLPEPRSHGIVPAQVRKAYDAAQASSTN